MEELVSANINNQGGSGDGLTLFLLRPVPIPAAGGVEGVHAGEAGEEGGEVAGGGGGPLEVGHGGKAGEQLPEEEVFVVHALGPEAGLYAKDAGRDGCVIHPAEVGVALEPIAVCGTQVEVTHGAENGVVPLPDGDFR